MKRIIVHWTAGGHKASSIDKKHYHFIFEGDGNEVRGNNPISANNRKVSGSNYAAHTRGCNSYSIGLSMACMLNATEKNYGKYPMTEAQFEAMAKKAAELCIEYDIPVTNKTVLSHAEVQKNLGIKQNGKWDFTVLPFRTDLKGQVACGNYFRQRVLYHIDQLTMPPMAFMSPVPDEVHEVLEDQDKGFFESTSNMANIVSGGAGTVSAAGGVLGFIESPWVQALLLVLIAGGVFWLLRERSRKAQHARVAKAAL